MPDGWAENGRPENKMRFEPALQNNLQGQDGATGSAMVMQNAHNAPYCARLVSRERSKRRKEPQWPSLNGEHNFPNMAAAFYTFMRFGGIFQRETLIHNRPDAA